MFQKAVRSQTKFKGAIAGPSGSGKTLGALMMARGLVGPEGKIAVIDTENGSASLYSDKENFDTVLIRPPYRTEKYIAAVKAAEEAGYNAVVIDSITHAWSGEGGLLQQKEQIDSRGGNHFTNWKEITPKHEKFMGTMLHSNVHLIATMRSKQDYIMEEGKNGKQMPKKVGLAPQQREGAEYEFTTVFDVAMNHEAIASKDRTGMFDGQYFTITKETGKQIRDWLNGANAAAAPQEVIAEESVANEEQTIEDIHGDLIILAAHDNISAEKRELIFESINDAGEDREQLESIKQRLIELNNQ